MYLLVKENHTCLHKIPIRVASFYEDTTETCTHFLLTPTNGQIIRFCSHCEGQTILSYKLDLMALWHGVTETKSMISTLSY